MSSIKIKQNCGTGEIDCKRFYLDGLDLEITCPNCGDISDWDDYLSYPNTNIPIDFNCYCGECDHEWVEKVKLNLSFEVVK